MLNFYVGLTACYFGRAKQDSSWKVEVEKASNLIELSFNHSTWNFENKLLLLKAESHYTKGEANEAAKCYEASIKSARVHKFVHEEAVACELAGYFFKEQGDETKSCNMFIQARDAYIKWGATGKANLLPLWHPYKILLETQVIGCSPSSGQYLLNSFNIPLAYYENASRQRCYKI